MAAINKDRQAVEKALRNLVARYYWEDDINCTPTSIRVLARFFDLQLSEQQVESAVGPLGMGRLHPQCGLLEGALLFMEIIGSQMQYREEEIEEMKDQYKVKFKATFKHVDCLRLRPKGTPGASSPHVCENLSCKALMLATDFICRQFHLQPHLE